LSIKILERFNLFVSCGSKYLVWFLLTKGENVLTEYKNYKNEKD